MSCFEMWASAHFLSNFTVNSNRLKKHSQQNKNLYVLRFMIISVFCHLLCSVSAETDATPLPDVSSTVIPTSTTNRGGQHNTTTTTHRTHFTLNPSERLDYSLVLEYSGPAVLDSTITFWVDLIPDTNQSTADWPFRYIFQWMNMATLESSTTEAGLNSEISITFSSDSVKAGDYPMTVAAFLKEEPTQMVAFQTRKFTLTEKLNGKLYIFQSLVYQRYPNVFSTNIKTKFDVSVLDNFQSERKPSWKYKWFENGTYIKSTQNSSFVAIFAVPTKVALMSEVFAKFSENAYLFNRIPNSRQLTDSISAALLPVNQISLSKTINQELDASLTSGYDDDKKHFEKDGNFTAQLSFKDGLTLCQIVNNGGSTITVATRSVKVINVTCSGSTPSSICWKTSAPNASVIVPCEPADFIPSTTHQINVTLNETGWINLHFFIYNDISRVHINQSIYAYNQESGESSALYLPIIFGLLGVIIIVIGAVYMMRIRKKHLVEVADFDFHPSLTNSIEANNSLRISRIMSSLKYLLFVKNKQLTTNVDDGETDSNFSRTPLTESTESTKAAGVYGSL